MKIIDISMSINEKTPLWPGNQPPRFVSVLSMDKGESHNETFIEMNSHTGTHIDAPLHFIPTGQPVDQIDPSVFIGPAFVVSLPNVTEITVDDLEKSVIPPTIKKILFKTSNSLLWGKRDSVFTQQYVGLTPDAASWLVKHGVELVGNDYLSVAKFEDAVDVHNILLGAGVALLEGIDLSRAEEGVYKLVCLPIKISGTEAAPTRAILIAE